jgi:CRP/FNR family transcriptional regulator
VKSGRVTISDSIDSGAPSITRIVGAGGIFGESCLVGPPNPFETATVLDQTRVMQWDRNSIEQLVERQPALGMALVRLFVQRCAELNTRIEALAIHRTPERVMLGLLQLAETLGTQDNGTVRLAPLTHQTIAEYVGTSREIVTSQMTELRRAGVLQYSRRFIEVNISSLRDSLREHGVHTPQWAAPVASANTVLGAGAALGAPTSLGATT